MTTTRKYNAIEINHIAKTINVSKAFLNKASKMGTKEYKTLVDAMSAHPTYSVEIKENENKKTYSNLTIDTMREIIKTQPDAEAKMAEFNKVLEVGKAIHAMYPRAKKWMFQNYAEILKNMDADTNDVNANLEDVA